MTDCNRQEFLEYTVLLILLNPNLYLQLQAELEESIRYSRSTVGGDILSHVLDEAKDLLTGPEDITPEQLEQIKSSVEFKMAAYRRTGNHYD